MQLVTVRAPTIVVMRVQMALMITRQFSLCSVMVVRVLKGLKSLKGLKGLKSLKGLKGCGMLVRLIFVIVIVFVFLSAGIANPREHTDKYLSVLVPSKFR